MGFKERGQFVSLDNVEKGHSSFFLSYLLTWVQ